MRVTVIMPIYNAEKYLSDAIRSILSQTYTDFELLAIDDGSSDNSLKILKSFDDSRIKIIQNQENIGLINTLNKAIDLAKGEFIARMDADDISLPTRFEKQVKLLINNPDIGVCSTWIELFGDIKKIIKYPVNHDEICIRFLLGVQVGHANSMIRRSLFEKLNLRYNNSFPHAEDANLWVNLLPFTRFANIPEILYRYRKYNEQVTQMYSQTVRNSFQRSINIHFKYILSIFSINSKDEIDLYPSIDLDAEYLAKFENISKELVVKNSLQQLFNSKTTNSVILQLWKNKMRQCKMPLMAKLRILLWSDFFTHIEFPFVKRIRFFTRLI